jgi:glucose-1-phosphate thymidylyltransferase
MIPDPLHEIGTPRMAVVLAAGEGSRMRVPQPGIALTADQERAASLGLKALMPINGYPFLDYVLGALAKSGFDRICVVIGPDHGELRARYEAAPPKRVGLTFQTQERPRGTADALLQAESYADGAEFLLINSDNYYLPRTLMLSRKLTGPGLIGFQREMLLRGGNITRERTANCALLDLDDEGYLTAIHEKPGAEYMEGLPEPVWLSMSCWRFGPRIFEACRLVEPSERGEYEIPDAVTIAMQDLGERFQVLTCVDAVFDLSSRRNVPEVEELLRGVEVAL